jgi:hypothetical protein
VSTNAFERNLNKIEVKKADFQETTIPEEPQTIGEANGPNAIAKLDTDSSIDSPENCAPTETTIPPSDPKPSPSEDSFKLTEINNHKNPKIDSYSYREASVPYPSKLNGVAQSLLPHKEATATYEVKLDNRLDQRLDYYRNSNKEIPVVNNNNNNAQFVFSDRYNPEPLKPSTTANNAYNIYDQNNVNPGSGQRRSDALIYNGSLERKSVNGSRMNYSEKDKVKKDWLERLEEYTDAKCIPGFPGEKLKEIQKENRNKFGEEFVEIILARFKMNYTVKVVYKLIQLLAKRRAKGT